MIVHEISKIVEAKDLDDLNHVNNVVYLQWVQDVASSHWFSKAGKDSGVIWVVRKHEIEYLAPALEADTLKLRTWVESMEGLSSLRKVEILRGDELICRCTSQWIMLDAKSFRPRRIPKELADLFIAES
ncbi:acyl-CoA thioesterase [Croceimicrobium sp.]|uniref:acyl-CoA thioesterase n=1 Tax=Croceimicrobium sp. TaxID=2828340 RepID=UPI003BAB66D6